MKSAPDCSSIGAHFRPAAQAGNLSCRQEVRKSSFALGPGMPAFFLFPLPPPRVSAQQPAPAAPPPPAPTLPQPIARVAVRPAEFALKVGDTLRLAAVAYDSAGKVMADVVIRWFTSGGRFEGKVDSTGLVSAGATGTLNVAAIASDQDRAVKPTIGFAHVTVLPLPAARVVVTPRPARLLAATSLVLEAAPYAANDDRRYAAG